MIDNASDLFTSLWSEFLGPTYGGTLYYLSQITAVSEESLDIILMSVVILSVITVIFNTLPLSFKESLNLVGQSTYNKFILVLSFWIWFEINIRLGTRATVLYFFGDGNALFAGPTSYAIAILPSLAQALYIYKPSKRQSDQQFEKTLFVLDVVATAVGLGITAGYPPHEFFNLHLNGNPLVVMIWLFAWGGNYWAENVPHDLILGQRGSSSKASLRRA